MISSVERFWIAFILRFAFGFLFLFAALNIFSYGPVKFAGDLSKPMANTWVGDVEAKVVSLVDPTITYDDAPRTRMAWGFLVGMPYLMAGLATCILTGILLRPALRLGALLLVILGLGKYLQNDVAATAADFGFALMICIGLYFLSLDKKRKPRVVGGESQIPEQAPA